MHLLNQIMELKKMGWGGDGGGYNKEKGSQREKQNNKHGGGSDIFVFEREEEDLEYNSKQK